MISRFTHLIYGGSPSGDEDSQTPADQRNTESALLTTSTEESDEWLIVDRSGDSCYCIVLYCIALYCIAL